jgi:signal transduction histidine kinase
MTSRLSKLFHDMPIRRKLRIIFVLTASTALLLAGLAIIVADSALFYNSLQRDLATFVRIVGDNSTGALAFDDAKAAKETLAALRARSHVQIACLYQKSGDRLLASYSQPDYQGVCPPPRGEYLGYEDGGLLASHEILLDGKPLGALVVRYDLNEILERVQLHGGTVIGALLLSCAVTIVLSARLRALIAEPIYDLASTTRLVTQSQDYSLRATKRSNDELGELADALNQMMDVIQARDAELQSLLRGQRDALERLAQLNADLQRSNSDLERFAFMASHDLQEPLRMITLYTQIMVNKLKGGELSSTDGYAAQIVSGTRRMRELLADMLAYSEFAGLAAQAPEPVDLNRVVEQVRAGLIMGIADSGAEILVDSLPVLQAHERRIESLFQNLIENAIKYRSSERPLQIRITFREEANALNFAVSDNGIGIQDEYREKIFVAFQRLHGKEIPGTGVGLAICQRVIDRYAGRIWVESEFGVGSTFRFVLPKAMLGSWATTK